VDLSGATLTVAIRPSTPVVRGGERCVQRLQSFILLGRTSHVHLPLCIRVVQHRERHAGQRHVQDTGQIDLHGVTVTLLVGTVVGKLELAHGLAH